MTSLFRLDADAATIGRRFAARPGEDPWDGGEIAPGNFAPIVTAGREAIAGPRDARQPRRIVPRLWGVPPPPSADPRGAVLTVSNLESPFWIGNLLNSEFRCVVPATAFLVRGKGHDTQGRRRAAWIGIDDQPLFAMAALWKDTEIPSFALLSCDANAALRAEGVERMPVILPDSTRDSTDAVEQWLRGGWDRARALVRPCPASVIRLTDA